MSLQAVMAGSSGFLGTHLRQELERRGHRVIALVRRATKGPDESSWDPDAGRVDGAVVAAADVVINLAGSPTLGNPHSRKWSQALHDSRVGTTAVLAEAIAGAQEPPYFVAGNAVAWYGDHGSAELPETADSRGHSLMTTVCRDWQAARRTADRLARAAQPGQRSGLDGEFWAQAGARFFTALGIDPGRIIEEGASRNTEENAQLTKELLNPQPGETWLLVTSAFHMPRSVGLFRKAGFEVVPWPTDYFTTGQDSFGIRLDQPAENFSVATRAMREWVGLLAYWATGKIDEVWPRP